ncbi:MAG: hypothetical protein ACM3VV_00590 [Deltaproteobacteria bacterium]|nr:hypothetical protein [Nitrososphaeraceae archaeon]
MFRTHTTTAETNNNKKISKYDNIQSELIQKYIRSASIRNENTAITKQQQKPIIMV